MKKIEYIFINKENRKFIAKSTEMALRKIYRDYSREIYSKMQK